MESARAEDYHVERDVWMVARSAPPIKEVPSGYRLIHITEEPQWDKLAAFLLESYKEYDWFDPTYTGSDRLYEKMRAAAKRLDVRWFALEDESGRYVSKAGYFLTNGLARLQDVVTLPDSRRRGLSTTILTFIMRQAFDRGLKAVVLTTDADYPAVALYEKLGFVQLGHTIELMKYPRHNKM